MLRLDIGGSGLVLPQLGVPDFVDIPREAIAPLRSGWECGMGESERVKGEEGGGTRPTMQHLKNIK